MNVLFPNPITRMAVILVVIDRVIAYLFSQLPEAIRIKRLSSSNDYMQITKSDLTAFALRYGLIHSVIMATVMQMAINDHVSASMYFAILLYFTIFIVIESIVTVVILIDIPTEIRNFIVRFVFYQCMIPIIVE